MFTSSLLIVNTLIVNDYVNSVSAGETSDMMNSTRTPTFTNGFAVTTRINISMINIRILSLTYALISFSTLDDLNTFDLCISLMCDLNRTPIVMAKHGGSCVHFAGISTCGRTSRETVSHPQCPPLPTLCKISLPIYVIVTNKLLQPLTTTWYDSLVPSFSLLKI